MIEQIPNAINAGTASDPYKNATVRTIAKPDAQPTMQIPALPNVVKATHEQYQGIASSDTGFLRSASLKYQRLLGETQQTEQDVARLDYAIWMSDRAGVSVDHAFHHAEDVQKRLFDYADNISVYDGWKYFNEYMKKTNFEEKVLDKIDARFEGLYNSNLSSEEKEAGYEELRQEYLKAMAEFPSFKHAESWVPTSWLEGVASTVPYMTKIATAAAAGAAFMGLGAMALGSFGTLSPIALAATPMLAATAKFATFGAAAGGYAMSKQLIQNQHTISRLMWEDEQGNHLDPRVVYWSRHLSSALSAGTEMWAASAVLGNIGKLLFGNTLESVISTSLWKRAMQGGLLYAKGVGVESFEEGLQKVTEDVTDNLAKWVDSKLHGTNWDYVGFKDILKNAAGDFLQSIPTMMTLGLLPFAGSTAVSMATAKSDARTDARVYFDTESGVTISAGSIINPISEYDKEAVGKRIDTAANGRQKLAPIKVVPVGQSLTGRQLYRVVEGMDTYQALYERGVQNMQVEVQQRSDYTQQLEEENYAAFGDHVNSLAAAVGGRVDIQGGRAYIITDDAQKAFLKQPESTLAFEDNTSIPGTSGRYSVDLVLDVAGQSGKVIAGSEGTWAADRLVGSFVDSAINELEAQDVNTKPIRSVMSAIYRETRDMDAAQAADHITKASPRLMRQLEKLAPEQQALPSVQQLRKALSSPFDASTLTSAEPTASAGTAKKPSYEMTPEEFAEAAEKEGGVEDLVAERTLKARQENAQQDWEKAADAPVSDKAERHAETMQNVVDAIDAKVGTKTQVVAEADNLPAAVKQAAIELGLGPMDVRAAYHNGSVYIVAEASSADTIEATYAHEWVAHRGLRQLLGEDFDHELTVLYDRIGEKRIRSVVPASVQGQSKAYQVDEYLAIQAEKLQQGGTIASVELGYIQRAMEAVRRILRKLGFKVRMTDLEVRRLLADANAALGESVTDVNGKTTETEEAPPIEETEDVRFEQMDNRYFDALERGDEETARRIVDEVAKQKGYISNNDFRMNHKAPNSHDGFSARLDQLDESGLLPKGFWEHPNWFTSDDREMRSFKKVRDAVEFNKKTGGKGGIRLYRAIPKNIKEDMFRNGDWVTPDLYYAKDEGQGIPGGYKIIERYVPVEHVWWDVNSIAELGYDDGGDYAYRDTKNNRKLNDTVVRDDDGNIVPPSKRFNYRSDTMFEQAPPVGSPEFKTLFGNSKAVDENGNPKLLYHGSPNKSITALDNTGVRRINGGEPGYIYATDGYDLAEEFSREKFRGQSNLSVIFGDTGRVYPVYMRMENPLDFRNLTDTDIDNMVAAARKYSQFKNTVPAQLEKAMTDKGMAQQYLKREAEDLVSHLEEYGYDGLISEARKGGPYEYAVISPSQVYMAEPQDTRFEQRVRDPYLKWEPEETSTGTIKGAPEWVKTRKDLNKLRSLLRKLVKEGESGRYWYEESAEEVWRITQGDPEKTKKLIQLLAIYSPNNNVPNNTLMAIRAYNHWASGLAEEDLHSGMGELDEKARRALYHNEDWEGRKTGSFYDNLIYELVRKHPEAFPDMDITDVGTMDLWMARAFGYQVEAYSDDKGTGKYSFSENSTRRLAAELNAKLQPGEDPWTTHQIQAAIWSSMKTRYEIDAIKEMTNKESIASGWAWVENGKVKYPTSGESEKLHKQLWRKNALEKSGTSEEVKKLVEETGFSFKQAIYDSSQVVTWEANPSTALGYEINNASGPVLSGFTAKAVSLVVDPEGADMLAGKLGVPLSFIAPGSGAYAGAVSQNAQSNLFPTRIKGEGVSFDIVRKYARAIQYIFKQDAVPFFKPDSTPLTSESAKKEMLFKTVKYTRDEDGAITKTTTIPGSKFDTQAEADAFRDAYIAKKKLNPDDVAVHGGKYAKAVVMTFQDKLDRDKLISVLGELKEYLGDDAGYTKTGSNEITFINFRDDFTKAPYVYDETYLDGLSSFYEDYKDSFGIVSSTEIWTEGEYGYEHDWAEDPSGSKVLAEAGIADGSDLHSWVLGRRALFEALIKEYSGENLARVEELYRQGQLTEDTRFELSESGTAAGLDGSETKPRPISEKYMQRHRTQVQAAMKRGLTVPDRVLEAYAGEEWADKELADRKLIRSFSWILPLAKDVNTPEELKALVEEELQKQGFDVLGPKTPEDIDFYKRLLELSSPTTKQMYINSFMDIVNSDRSLRSLVQDISEARENWQGLGLPSFLWGLASKIGNGAQITDADLDMIRSYTINSREKMATAYYASRGDTAALSKMGSEDIVYGTEEPERRAINAALIKDPEVLRQMLDGTITYGRLVEYEEQLQQEMAVIEGENDDLQAEIDRLNKEIIERSEENKQKLKDQAAADREKLKTAIKAENQRRRSELTELRKAYKKRMESAISQLRDKQKERDEVRMAREFVERVAARMRRPVPPQTTSYTVGRKMEALAEFVIPSKWYRMEKTEDGLHRAEPDSTRATALIYYLSDPADDVETFLQDIQRFKDLTFGDFTTDQIALLYGITEHIRERGRREMAAFLESQRMRRDVAVNKILAEVLGGEKAQVFENIGSIESDKEQKSGAVFNAQAMSLRPPRMILLMSGGKEGVMYDWYINKINEATDAEIRNYQRRMKAGQQKMKELGLTVGMLEKELTYNDVTMRTDDVLHLWIGMKNEKNRNAILYGNKIALDVVANLTRQLTENQKAWATYMLDDFEAEYDRLNQTFIADRNQDMGKEQNYFTMIRQDLDQMPLGDEFASQIAVRNAWRKGYPNKSFSKERIEIADEHQKPIRLGATQIWFEQVSKQEHYIASAILAKDLQYISDNQVLRDGLKQRFGRRANSWLRKYVNDWANPTMYKSFDSVTRWMGVVRNNMAVAYLGFNLLTVLKQAPSLAFYLKGANPMNLLSAASEMVLHPFETIRFVESMDPQIAARSYDRLTEELKGYDPNKGVRAIRKVGQISMKPIMWMDKAMVTIGWLGVYKNQIAKGASELEAAREAQKVTLDTQPAGRPKDVAEMYRSNELANWFTMFSNQLNQIWNMYTFDIPNAIKQREAAKLAGILAGIGVSGIAIAYLSGWRAPEDPEDLPKEAAIELFKNFLSVVPFLGNGLKSGYDKFYGAGLDPFPVAYTAGKLMADVSGDPEKIGPDIASLVEDLAILTGLPVTGTKRLVNVGRYQHLNELMGYGFAQYTR